MRDDVVALYVDRLGPYPKLVREWYDEKRDARTYAGPLPVLWGALGARGAEGAPMKGLRRFSGDRCFLCGTQSVDAVDNFGGTYRGCPNCRIIEHPADCTRTTHSAQTASGEPPAKQEKGQ